MCEDVAAKRVLCIEDRVSTAEAFKRYLRGKGYDVHTATTQREGLKKLRGEPYDVVTVDLGIPIREGTPPQLGAGNKIVRVARDCPDPPVIIVVSETATRDETFQFGRDGVGYVTKAEENAHLADVLCEIERQFAERKRDEYEESITVRRQRDAEVYRILLDSSKDVIWRTDLQENVTYISPSVARMLGISSSDFEAKKFYENFVKEHRFVIREVFGEVLNAIRRGALDETLKNSTIVQAERSDGQRVWVEITAFPTCDEYAPITGLHGVISDVTDQKRMEARYNVGPYLSDKWISRLVRQAESPAIRSKMADISVLVCDVRKFTQMTNDMGVAHMLGLLNEFFDAISEVIESLNGTIGEFRGDGVLAFFGAPDELPNHTESAAVCALKMQRAMGRLNDKWERENRLFGRGPVQLGIGISSGTAILGNVGTRKIRKYTALGTTVNLAARVEAETNRERREILVTEGVYEKLDGKFKFGRPKRADLKGIGTVNLYPLLGVRKRKP